jgi:hypothetical protein
MPINVTPVSGQSDRIDDVRSHTHRGVDEPMVTSESLRRRPRWRRGHDDAHRIGIAKHVLRHYEQNESWGSSG